MQSLTIAGTFNGRWVATAATGRMARSVDLDVDETGSAWFADSGIELVLDLGEAGERCAPPHGVTVAHVPFYRLPGGPPVEGTHVYDFLITQRGRELGEAVAVIADATGPVLVHCTNGTERTGLVVALALLASGHTEPQVVDDHVSSHGLGLSLASPAQTIEHVLRTLDTFGGPEAFLIRHGVAAQQLRSLREKLGGQSDDTD
jgi:protein-tyrosine phosphatase